MIKVFENKGILIPGNTFIPKNHITSFRPDGDDKITLHLDTRYKNDVTAIWSDFVDQNDDPFGDDQSDVLNKLISFFDFASGGGGGNIVTIRGSIPQNLVFTSSGLQGSEIISMIYIGRMPYDYASDGILHDKSVGTLDLTSLGDVSLQELIITVIKK